MVRGSDDFVEHIGLRFIENIYSFVKQINPRM